MLEYRHVGILTFEYRHIGLQVPTEEKIRPRIETID